MTSGLTYPYTKYDRLLGDQLDLDLEFNPGTVPPSGTAGGAGRYKYWVDTTTSSLRQCIAVRATAGVYVPAEWITLGVIDIAGAKFHFNTDQVDFTGGSGALVVTNLTVTGATTLNTLTVTGATNLNTLNVSGASALHDTSITGALTVTGAITGGSLNTAGAINGASLLISGNAGIGGLLNVTGAITGGSLVTGGNINGASLNVSGDSSLHNTLVTGNLQATGAITGGSLSTTGTLTVGGAATIGSIAYLHVTGPGDVDGNVAVFEGNIDVNGGAVANTIHSNSTITGDSLNVATVAASGSITGGNLAVTGNINGASLFMTGSLNGTSAVITGPIVASATVEAEGYYMKEGGTSYMFANMGTDVGALATLILGPEFASTSQARIALYNTGQTYNKADEHNFWNMTAPFATYAVFNGSGTANTTGSWAVISDDSVKENVSPYNPGLAELLQLDVVSFNYMVPDPVTKAHWSPFADPFGTTTPKVHYGMMASNVLAVIPEMVTEMTFSDIAQGLPDTPLATIAPTHLVWVLTNAVKELSGQIETGADDVQALDTRVDHLEIGITDGSEAATGRVGEYLAIPNNTGVAVSTAVATQVCQVTLSAGDWEVWGSADYRPAGNTSPSMIASSISIHPSALPSDADIMTGIGILNMFTTNALTGGQRQVLMTGQCRAKTTAPLTLYMVVQTTFTGGGTILTKGYICARRVR